MIKIPKKIFIIIRNEKQKSTNKISYEKYITFGLGTLLSISESLPFFDIKYKGILHMFKNINEEYKKDLS